VNGLRPFPNGRASLPSTIRKGHNEVEVNSAKFGDELGPLAGDIDARLGHDANGVWVQAVGLDSGRIRLNQTSLQSARPSFSHLTATRVAGAKEENSQHHETAG
jgi:hypothetical protein